MNTVKSKDDTTIAFDRSGEGPVLILVDGALQHRAIDPSTVQLGSLLAPSFTVYHYDRRGRGDSGDKLPYAVEREVEDLDALINEAGGSAFVFGMSSGAVLALDAAASGLGITSSRCTNRRWWSTTADLRCPRTTSLGSPSLRHRAARATRSRCS